MTPAATGALTSGRAGALTYNGSPDTVTLTGTDPNKALTSANNIGINVSPSAVPGAVIVLSWTSFHDGCFSAHGGITLTVVAPTAPCAGAASVSEPIWGIAQGAPCSPSPASRCHFRGEPFDDHNSIEVRLPRTDAPVRLDHKPYEITYEELPLDFFPAKASRGAACTLRSSPGSLQVTVRPFGLPLRGRPKH